MNISEYKKNMNMQNLLADYKDIPFLFWTYKREGNPVPVSLKVREIKKYTETEVTLNGELIVVQNRTLGEISLNLALDERGGYTATASLKCKADKYKYLLTPNVNTEASWNEFISAIVNKLNLINTDGIIKGRR